jgi:hypothetical protein
LHSSPTFPTFDYGSGPVLALFPTSTHAFPLNRRNPPLRGPLLPINRLVRYPNTDHSSSPSGNDVPTEADTTTDADNKETDIVNKETVIVKIVNDKADIINKETDIVNDLAETDIDTVNDPTETEIDNGDNGMHINNDIDNGDNGDHIDTDIDNEAGILLTISHSDNHNLSPSSPPPEAASTLTSTSTLASIVM